MVAEQVRRETSLEESDGFVAVKEWFNDSIKYNLGYLCTFNHLLHACDSLNLYKDYHTCHFYLYCELVFDILFIH